MPALDTCNPKEKPLDVSPRRKAELHKETLRQASLDVMSEDQGSLILPIRASQHPTPSKDPRARTLPTLIGPRL